MIGETQSSFERVKRCTEIPPSVPRTLAKSARESDGRSRRGLNFVTVQTKMQSLPGKEVNNFMFDSVLADLFLVTSRRSQILLCRFRVAGIFSKGDKFLSEWATFDGLSHCRRCLGRRWPRPGKFVHTFFFLLVYPISLLLVPIFFRRGKICAHDCASLFAFLFLHSLIDVPVLLRVVVCVYPQVFLFDNMNFITTQIRVIPFVSFSICF